MVQDKKSLILSAAEATILTKGISALTMDGVANDASVSKMTVYKYFNNKDGLVKAVLEGWVAASTRVITQIIAESTNPLDALRLLFGKTDSPLRNLSPEASLDMVKNYNDLVAGVVTEARRKLIPLLEDLIYRAQQEGYVRKDLSPHIIVLFMQATKEYFQRPDIYSSTSDITSIGYQIISIFMKGILREGVSIDAPSV